MPYFSKVDKPYLGESDFWCSEMVIIKIFMLLSSMTDQKAIMDNTEFSAMVGEIISAIPDELELINLFGRTLFHGDFPDTTKVSLKTSYQKLKKLHQDHYSEDKWLDKGLA